MLYEIMERGHSRRIGNEGMCDTARPLDCHSMRNETQITHSLTNLMFERNTKDLWLIEITGVV